MRGIPAKSWRSTWWTDKTYHRDLASLLRMCQSQPISFSKRAETVAVVRLLDPVCRQTNQKIGTLREKHANTLTGVNPNIVKVFEKRWNACSDLIITQDQNNANNFLVQRRENTLLERNQFHQIWTEQKVCSCGRWQEFAIPCVDAMAYFRYYCKMSFTDVLKHHVAKYHTFQAEHDILKYNVNPVVLETLVKDEKTLPPRATSANRTGRPKTKRLRVRNVAPSTDRKPIQCSVCHEVGHNSRTCLLRLRNNDFSNRDIT